MLLGCMEWIYLTYCKQKKKKKEEAADCLYNIDDNIIISLAWKVKSSIGGEIRKKNIDYLLRYLPTYLKKYIIQYLPIL